MSISSSLIRFLLLLFVLFVSGKAEIDEGSKTKDEKKIEVQLHLGMLHKAVHGIHDHIIGKHFAKKPLHEKPKKPLHEKPKKPLPQKHPKPIAIGVGIGVGIGIKKGPKIKPPPKPKLPKLPKKPSPKLKNPEKPKKPEPVKPVPVVVPKPVHPVPVPVPVPVGPGVVAGTDFPGAWELVSKDSGVSAMHMQLMPNDKLMMFDATSLGKSNIQLPPNNCVLRPPEPLTLDCWSHSVEFDIHTSKVRVLKVVTNPWCSSGALATDGTLVGTGGWGDGDKTLRYINPCDTCDWRESKIKLADQRWYSTHVMLGDGRFVLFGGRRAWNYEFIAPEGQPSPGRIDLPFLRETNDFYENNLYPFVHVTPDGNVFILSNFKSILFDVRTNKIVRTYPDLLGGARNYPGSACSAILMIDLKATQNRPAYPDMEVIVCGGGDPVGFGKAENEKIYLPAVDTCGRIRVMDPNPQWAMEKMPTPRLMSDMLNLPNGELLIINGAQKGASGWTYAQAPNFAPIIYTPNKPVGQRFRTLAPTLIARMYHSTSALLPDGKIMVAGSNTNDQYKLVGAEYPTELRVEKFSPPYLDPKLANLRPVLKKVPKPIHYAKWFNIEFQLNAPPAIQDLMVTLYKPPFTTHGYSMNQRLLSLPIAELTPEKPGFYKLNVQAPATGELAPPGYQLLYLNYQGVPGVALWTQLIN